MSIDGHLYVRICDPTTLDSKISINRSIQASLIDPCVALINPRTWRTINKSNNQSNNQSSIVVQSNSQSNNESSINQSNNQPNNESRITIRIRPSPCAEPSTLLINQSLASVYRWSDNDTVKIIDPTINQSINQAITQTADQQSHNANRVSLMVWPLGVSATSQSISQSNNLSNSASQIASVFARQFRNQTINQSTFSSITLAINEPHLIWIKHVEIGQSNNPTSNHIVKLSSTTLVECSVANVSPVSVSSLSQSNNQTLNQSLQLCYPREWREITEWLDYSINRSADQSVNQFSWAAGLASLSSCRCFLLTGTPRSGKSFILQSINQYINQSSNQAIDQSNNQSLNRIKTITIDPVSLVINEEQIFNQLNGLIQQIHNADIEQSNNQYFILADDIDLWLESDLSSRVRSVFLALLDLLDTNQSNNQSNNQSISLAVIGTCSSDRRVSVQRVCARFDVSVDIAPLMHEQREVIINQLINQSDNQSDNQSLDLLVRRTHGYVSGDLFRLYQNAFLVMKARSLNQTTSQSISESAIAVSDFEQAFRILSTQPGFSSVSQSINQSINQTVRADSITMDLFSRVGGNQSIKQMLVLYLQSFVESATESMKQSNNQSNNQTNNQSINRSKQLLASPRGILLTGSHGSGKSLIVRSLDCLIGLTVMHVHVTDIISPLLGASEENLRNLFMRARRSAPCILLFDDIDALISIDRSTDDDAGEGRLLSSLLQELDGVTSNNQSAPLLIIGATTRPNALDSALTRAGRFDARLDIKSPTFDDAVDILKTCLNNEHVCLNESVSLNDIVELYYSKLKQTSSSHWLKLLRMAVWQMWRRHKLDSTIAPELQKSDFEVAAKHIRLI